MFKTTDIHSEAAITAAIVDIVASVAPEWQPNTAIIQSAVASVCGDLDSLDPLIEIVYYDISAAVGKVNPIVALSGETPSDVLTVFYPPEQSPQNTVVFAAAGVESIGIEATISSAVTMMTAYIKRAYDMSAPDDGYASNIPRTLAKNYVVPLASAKILALLALNAETDQQRNARQAYSQWLISTHKLKAAPVLSGARVLNSIEPIVFSGGTYSGSLALTDDARLLALETAYPWANITGKPSTFAPSSHTHLWADITDKPSTFTPSSHTHSASDIISGTLALARLDSTVIRSSSAGTANSIAKFTDVNAVGNSLLSDSGTTLNYAGTIFQINSNGPNFVFRKANAPADQKFWRSYVSDSQFVFDVVNDAYTAAQNYYIVTRSGTAVTTHQWFVGGVNYASLLSGGAFKIYDQSTNKINHLSIVGGNNGANIELLGNGATTQNKFIRAANGSFEIINHAYSGAIFMLSDTGILNFPSATSRLQIAGTQVVGPRETGFAPMTGTTNKGTTYDTSTVTLALLAGRVMALQAALTTHGLIGA